jgi:hypothetical protein
VGTVHIGLHVGCDASVKQARADEQDKPLDQIVDEPKRDPVDDAIEQGLTGVQNGLDKLVDSASDGLDELDKALDQVEDEPVTPEPSKADETPFLDQLGAALVKEINDGLDPS